jgi:hypothetical protein
MYFSTLLCFFHSFQEKINFNTKMEIIPFNKPIYLKAHTGNNLQNHYGSALCQSKNTGSWEQLIILQTNDGKVVIQSVLNGNNLQVQPNGACAFANKNMLLWEKFEVEGDDSALYFISCHTGNVLQCNNCGIVSCLNQNRLSWEAWKILCTANTSATTSLIENKATVAAKVGGATAGAITGVSVCSATIAGLGFTSGGIAAGSTAASMMAAEAVAAGGGVAAGSTVATLQSIGALGIMGGGGLGFLLIASSAIVFGTLGASIALGISKIVSKQSSDELIKKCGVRHGRWMVITEEGIGNLINYTFQTEEQAWEFFHKHWCFIARIIFDPCANELSSAGWNGLALPTIRNYVKTFISTSSGRAVTGEFSPRDVLALYSTKERRFVCMWGEYVGAGDFGKTPDSKTSPHEEFTVVDAGNGEIALHCKSQNRFLRVFGNDVDSKGGEKSPSELPADWDSERFTVIDAGNGNFVLFLSLFHSVLQ